MIQLAKISWAEQKLASRRPSCGPGKSVGMLGKNPTWVGPLVSPFVVCQPGRRSGFSAPLAQRCWKRCGKGPTGKASGLAWTHGTWCVHVHQPAIGMSWRNMGHTQSFSSSSSGSQWLSRRQRSSSPLSLRNRSRRGALIGLHLLAAEDDAGSSGSQSSDLEDVWRCGCSKSPDWDSVVESWTEKRRHFI